MFIALVFRVDDAKINCSLEKCFRIGLKRSRTGNETIRNTLLYIVFPDGRVGISWDFAAVLVVK